jgi:type VI secretion system secreted protein Hcp
MGRCDMFLKAVGQKSGEILGEANDAKYLNQIEISDWNWGMSSPTAITGQAMGRVKLQELRVVKAADRASTALANVMRTNELLKTVKLTVRKAGGTVALPYFVVTLEDARVVEYTVQSTISDSGAPTLVEHLSFTFRALTIDYTPQGTTGGQQGASSVTVERPEV